MGYRDDLSAAHERVAALEAELEQRQSAETNAANELVRATRKREKRELAIANERIGALEAELEAAMAPFRQAQAETLRIARDAVIEVFEQRRARAWLATKLLGLLFGFLVMFALIWPGTTALLVFCFLAMSFFFARGISARAAIASERSSFDKRIALAAAQESPLSEGGRKKRIDVADAEGGDVEEGILESARPPIRRAQRGD